MHVNLEDSLNQTKTKLLETTDLFVSMSLRRADR